MRHLSPSARRRRTSTLTLTATLWVGAAGLGGALGCDGDGGPSGEAEVDAALPGAEVGPPGDAAPRLDDAGSGAGDAGADAGDAGTEEADAGRVVGPPRCNDAWGEVDWPAGGVVTLSHDDGVGVASVRGQTWSIVGVPVDGAPLFEAVRFDLPGATRVVGIEVQWDGLPADPEAPVALGLFGDFGHNGFDFWAPEPLWTGARCRGDLEEGAWSRYVLRTPLAVDHSGPIFVAHRRADADAPAWQFDGTPPTPDCGDNCCAPYAACHSAWNFPELKNFSAGGQQNYAWNGLSLTFQYDYLVRLVIEPVTPTPAAALRFAPVTSGAPVGPGAPDTAEAPPTPSNRMAWGDYDGDGRVDLLGQGPRLWRNTPDGFEEVTDRSGIAVAAPGVGPAQSAVVGAGVFGDFDNDGCADVFVFDEAYDRSDHLMRNNCDGTFTDVTVATGIVDVQSYNRCDAQPGGPANDRTPTPAAAWADLDGDGLVDLYLANFICWSAGTQYTDRVWRNNGDGTFSDWTGTLGLLGEDDPRLASRGVSAIDHDQDGDLDLLVNNYRLQRNLHYLNQTAVGEDGQRTVAFEEVGRASRLAGRRARQGINEYYGHTIGTAFGDVNGDGRWDVVQANLAHPRFWDFSSKTEVLLGQPDGSFLDNQGDWSRPAGAAGLRYQETHSVPVLADFDNDGHLDLGISAVYEGRPTDFYRGRGDATFELDADRSGIPVQNGWGMAAADFDGDGFVDLAANGVLLRNQGRAAAAQAEAEVAGPTGALELQLVGDAPGTNRMALGATARVYAGDRVWLRHVSGGDGQGCQASPFLHVGLGALAAADRIEVDFIGLGTVRFAGPFAAGARYVLAASGAVTGP